MNDQMLAEPLNTSEAAPEPYSYSQDDIEKFGRPIAPDTATVWNEIVRLDLTYHVAELEVRGYTVIPPEKVAPPEFAARLREAILDVSERRSGVRPDLDGGSTHVIPGHGFGQMLYYVLLEDPVFQEAMLNPVGMALARYMVGENAIASNCIANIKGPGGADLFLHADNALFPAPFPSLPHVCNITYALTDYTRENGALCFVPGSHKFHRHPLPGEALDQREAVECPAGSMIFWGGQVWHGAFARTNPGLRVNLLMAIMRPHLRPQEDFSNVPDEIIARNGPRFRKLMGRHLAYGWREKGPTNEVEGFHLGRHAYD